MFPHFNIDFVRRAISTSIIMQLAYGLEKTTEKRDPYF
jgi:hypothetical protein